LTRERDGRHQSPGVRAVVICAEPDTAQEPGSVAAILAELGCRVTLGRFDLGGLDLDELAERPPTVVVVEAGDDLGRAQKTIKRLRDDGPLIEVPILVAVTVARLSLLDFSIGFDDFVLMPLVPAELYARMRQLDWKTATFGSDEVLKIDDLVIDIAGYEVRIAGRRIELTHQEFELLRFLAQHRGRVFTREALLERAWGYRYAGGTRTVDIHVRRVRSKLGEMGSVVETVRNVGYKMRG
jgi:DNA-binding response OmpR family regulator